MKKLLLFGIFAFVTTLTVSAQVKFDLKATNVYKYIGKVDRAGFEEIIGEPVNVRTENGVDFYVYNVYSMIGNNNYGSQAITCLYRNDGKLAQLWFTHSYPDMFRIDFPEVPGYDKNKTEQRRNSAGVVTYLKYYARGMSMTINEYRQYSGIWHGKIQYGIIVQQ